MDTPIPLSKVLEIAGLDAALWSLRCVIPEEEKDRDRIARLFACDCAEAVLGIFESEMPDDKRPRSAIALARRFAVGEASQDELAAAAYAAATAYAASAAANAASAAAYAAAYAASAAASPSGAAAAAAATSRIAAGAAAYAAGAAAYAASAAASAASADAYAAGAAAYAVYAAAYAARAAARDAQTRFFLTYINTNDPQLITT